MSTSDAWQEQREALGAVIRNQRQLAQLSLRQMADLAKVSNPYLSQLERGLHEPSRRVLQGIADALGVPVESILAQAGLGPESPPAAGANGGGTPNGEAPSRGTEDAIRADPLLTPEQRDALISVYRSYTAGARRG